MTRKRKHFKWYTVINLISQSIFLLTFVICIPKRLWVHYAINPFIVSETILIHILSFFISQILSRPRIVLLLRKLEVVLDIVVVFKSISVIGHSFVHSLRPRQRSEVLMVDRTSHLVEKS